MSPTCVAPGAPGRTGGPGDKDASVIASFLWDASDPKSPTLALQKVGESEFSALLTASVPAP